MTALLFLAILTISNKSYGASFSLQDIANKINSSKTFETLVVNAADMRCTSQETNGKIELTLVTCDKDNTKRLVVKCRAVT